MKNEHTPDLPDYLAELLQPTPSGAAKLIAAWDGLSTESKMILLTALDRANFPGHLAEKVLDKALESESAYVRYLAVGRLCSSDEKTTVKKRIEEDPEPLVRYSLIEKRETLIFDAVLQDPTIFFSLPQEARLAYARTLGGSGEKLAKLISHAVDHYLKDGTVSEIELFEILSDYLNDPKFKQYYANDVVRYDGWVKYSGGRDIDALWELVLKVPEGISHVLITHLPPGAGPKPFIPEEVVRGMSDQQLTTLLYRKDVRLEKLRKKIFFDADEKNDFVKSAAIWCNFNLEYKEFQEILASSEKEKVRMLKDLATKANDLSLCIYDAVYDTLFITEGEFDLDYAGYAKDFLERRLSELQGRQRDEEIRELRLYRLAKETVPLDREDKGHPPPNELEFLREFIVKGDTWGTFMAFSDAWSSNLQRERLAKYLPRIHEVDEDELDDAFEIYEDELADSKFLAIKVEKRLTDILSTMSIMSESEKKRLARGFSQLGAQLVVRLARVLAKPE